MQRSSPRGVARVSGWHPKVLPCRQGLQLVVSLWLCVSDCVCDCVFVAVFVAMCS